MITQAEVGMKENQEKIEIFKGRPKREKRIVKDDLLNLKIALYDNIDVTDFIQKIQRVYEKKNRYIDWQVFKGKREKGKGKRCQMM